jgi:hypothetical protein
MAPFSYLDNADLVVHSGCNSRIPRMFGRKSAFAMDEPAFNADLAFLHLSDIHFRKGRVGDVHDVDSDLRNELERDLRNVRSKKVRKLDGIIVSGDVAFGGQPEEFAYAQDWLEKIRELLDCPKNGIMTIPGNHDVDRNAVMDGSDADQLHASIRAQASLAERDAKLAEILRDGTRGPQIFQSIAAYNDFAMNYGCEVGPLKPYWERDFRFGNRATLRIRGVTSTIISGPRDRADTHKVIYGAAQRILQRDDGIVRMVVGHHPPSWTIEGDDLDRAFSERSLIQLYGHKHDQWYAQAGRGIRIIAGAVHPDPTESNWEPRYSVVAIKLDSDGFLKTRVFPRKWSREEMTFIGDYNSQDHDYRDHTVSIDG